MGRKPDRAPAAGGTAEDRKTPELHGFRGGGGGWGIRTPEGLHPTRFPSVRHRPLGESSRRSTRRQPRATRKEYIGTPIPGASPGRWDLSREVGGGGSQPGAGSGSLSLGPSCGVIQRIPQDRKVARVSRLWRVREGSSRLPVAAGRSARAAGRRARRRPAVLLVYSTRVGVYCLGDGCTPRGPGACSVRTTPCQWDPRFVE